MAEVPRAYLAQYPNLRRMKVAASTTVEKGNALSKSAAGYVRHLDTSDAEFCGFAAETVSNAGADGAESVRVIPEGVIDGTIAGVNDSSHDRIVYMSSSTFFTLTVASNLRVGRISEVRNGAGDIYIRFQAESYRNPDT